jgi:hypothetical protein
MIPDDTLQSTDVEMDTYECIQENNLHSDGGFSVSMSAYWRILTYGYGSKICPAWGPQI